MRTLLILMVIFMACAKNESSTVDLIKNVAAEARSKPRVQVMIRMAGDAATPDELELQRSIEDRIERAHIGRLVGSGSEAGYMNVTIEVETTAKAITELRAVLRDAGVESRSSFKILPAS
jgi:predicted TIM-barrel enzyme